MNDPHDDDDAALFRHAIGAVRILPERAPAPAPPRPKPRARMAERDEANARDEFRHPSDAALLEADDPLSYRHDSFPADTWQRLRRGEMAAQEELDLHGTDARTAEALLRAFLGDALRHGLGCVRIIHGKGGRERSDFSSSGAPVLKNLVDRMLRHRSSVLAFHSPPPAQGGAGAVVVVLSRQRRR
ncbi:Smr/MutS family protein [Lysobacter sp. A286]